MESGNFWRFAGKAAEGRRTPRRWRDGHDPRVRKASWSAPVLWRFPQGARHSNIGKGHSMYRLFWFEMAEVSCLQKRRRAAALQDAGATAMAHVCAKRPGVRQSSGAFLRAYDISKWAKGTLCATYFCSRRLRCHASKSGGGPPQSKTLARWPRLPRLRSVWMYGLFFPCSPVPGQYTPCNGCCRTAVT